MCQRLFKTPRPSFLFLLKLGTNAVAMANNVIEIGSNIDMISSIPSTGNCWYEYYTTNHRRNESPGDYRCNCLSCVHNAANPRW